MVAVRPSSGLLAHRIALLLELPLDLVLKSLALLPPGPIRVADAEPLPFASGIVGLLLHLDPDIQRLHLSTVEVPLALFGRHRATFAHRNLEHTLPTRYPVALRLHTAHPMAHVYHACPDLPEGFSVIEGMPERPHLRCRCWLSSAWTNCRSVWTIREGFDVYERKDPADRS
jgi:hypothetical protein